MASDVVAALSDDPWQRAAARVMRSVKSENKQGPTAEKLGKIGMALAAEPYNAVERLMKAAATSRPGENEALVGPSFETAMNTFGMNAPVAVKGAAGALGGKLTQPQGIRAYHGSPHDFDKFDLSKIGTGEGAQAYGHGLYFAENPKVAEEYKRALSEDVFLGGKRVGNSFLAQGSPKGAYDAIRAFAAEKGDLNKAVEFLEEQRRMMPALSKGIDENIAWLRANEKDLEYRPGKMYEVNIRANPDDFLDWDKAISSQPAALNAAQSAGLRTEVISGLPEKLRSVTGMEMFAELDRRYQGSVGRPETSNLLREHGIPGIKYLDQGSRTAGEGSRNYVVFDDSIIDILKKYGLFGLGAIPVMSGAAGGDNTQ